MHIFNGRRSTRTCLQDSHQKLDSAAAGADEIGEEKEKLHCIWEDFFLSTVNNCLLFMQCNASLKFMRQKSSNKTVTLARQAGVSDNEVKKTVSHLNIFFSLKS